MRREIIGLGLVLLALEASAVVAFKDAAKATAAVEKGFKGLKWDPFGKNYRQLPPADFKKALACVAAVKGETEGKAEILIECHGRFDLPTALRLCNALEEFDDVPWRKDVIDEDVKFVDGMMYPSDRPGLGIELNEEAAAAHSKADHWLRHYVGTLTNIRPPDSISYFHP